MKPRTKKPSKSAATKDATSSHQGPAIKCMDSSLETPPRLFILPKEISQDARIVTISGTSCTAVTGRVLICPLKGFYQFTRVTAPKGALRSWLLSPDRAVVAEGARENGGDLLPDEQGYVLQCPDLFIATPIDPLFVAIEMMVNADTNDQGTFLTSFDYLHSPDLQGYEQLQQMLQHPDYSNLKRQIEARMLVVSDTLDLGDDDERMYRLSLPKLAEELLTKSKRMTVTGLPASMEDRFVKQALAMPVLDMMREDSTISVATDEGAATVRSDTISVSTSQETDASVGTTLTTSTTATSVNDPTPTTAAATEAIVDLLRLRTALDYIMTTSVPRKLHSRLNDVVASDASPVDFSPLNTHLKRIADLKQEVQALRSLSDNISRKRRADDDEEAMEKAEAKKRKTEEEELRKKSVSHGVKKLMKADTSGMKKLSSFFTKAPAKK